MSLLPGQIPPETVPIGTLEADGRVKITHNFWLYLYNLGQLVLGTTGVGAAAYSAQVNAEAQALVDSTDSLGLAQRVTNLERGQVLLPDPQPPRTVTVGLLTDPVPQAQPAQVLTPGASPWVYTALQDGWLILSGGTVSAITLSRDGTTFYATGWTTGVFPMSRLDQTKVTYTGAPTATYFPR